jgi:hypothetical protein
MFADEDGSIVCQICAEQGPFKLPIQKPKAH